VFTRPSMFGPPAMFRAPGMFTGKPAEATGVESEWCVGFSGASGNRVVTDANYTRPSNGLTVSCWLYAASWNGTTGNVLVCHRDGSTKDQFQLNYWISGNLIWNVWDSAGANKYVAVTAPSLNTWHHVVGTVYDGRCRIYIDGVETVGDAVGTLRTPSAYPICFGTQYWNQASGMWNGRVDDFMIFDRGMSLSEAQSIYANTSARPSDYWLLFDFEDGTGTTTAIKDDSGATIGTATLTGASWHPQTPPKLVSGRALGSGCVSFDGSDDYVDCGNSSLFDLQSIFSVSAWIKVPSIAGERPIIGRGDTTERWYFYLGDGGAGKLVLGSRKAGSFTYAQSDVVIATNSWTHVAAVVDDTLSSGQRIKLFVNGSQVATTVYSWTNGFGSSSSPATIGRTYSSSGPVYGAASIDDVRIYSTALTAAQVASLARNQDVTTGLVARWKLDDGSGDTAEDSVGTADGTLVGGPTWSTDVSPYHVQ